MRARILPVVILALAAIDCGSKTPVTPPSPIDDPKVSCPADIAVTAHNLLKPTVTFDTPVGSGGVPPLTVTCAPPSGGQFDFGKTTVTCTAADTRQKQGSCTFAVNVTPVPQLTKTTFMAFGDSMTQGKLGGIVDVPTDDPRVIDLAFSYVESLSVKLSARYIDQTTTVIAEGVGNEEAGEGKLRLPGALAAHPAQVLLLLEGVNDLTHTSNPSGLPGAITSVVDALRQDIVTARSRNVQVFVATLPPLNPAKWSQASSIPTLNTQIVALAKQEGATLVDMNAAIPLGAVGADGLHLTATGYDLMADEWLKAVQSTLEVKIPSGTP